jgi:hypothetical protein
MRMNSAWTHYIRAETNPLDHDISIVIYSCSCKGMKVGSSRGDLWRAGWGEARLVSREILETGDVMRQ